MTGQELERLMVAQFGPDFREKTVAGWPLADCFEECGLEDPKRPRRPPAGCYGLPQFMPPGRARGGP